MTIPGLLEDCAVNICNDAVRKLERYADYHATERTHLAGSYYKDAAVFEKLARLLQGKQHSLTTELVLSCISTKLGKEFTKQLTPYLT